MPCVYTEIQHKKRPGTKFPVGANWHMEVNGPGPACTSKELGSRSQAPPFSSETQRLIPASWHYPAPSPPARQRKGSVAFGAGGAQQYPHDCQDNGVLAPEPQLGSRTIANPFPRTSPGGNSTLLAGQLQSPISSLPPEQGKHRPQGNHPHHLLLVSLPIA